MMTETYPQKNEIITFCRLYQKNGWVLRENQLQMLLTLALEAQI